MTDRFQADAEEMRTRRLLTELVGSGLSRNEQETTFAFFGDADRFKILSYRPTLVRTILRHSYADIEWVYVAPSEGRKFRAEDLSALWESDPDAEIEGVAATLPLGALTIKGQPRTSDRISGIAHTPEDAAEAAESFRGEST